MKRNAYFTFQTIIDGCIASLTGAHSTIAVLLDSRKTYKARRDRWGGTVNHKSLF